MTRFLPAPAAPLAAIALLIAVPASAAEQRPYSPTAMQAVQTAGKPVILDISATWCTTCAAQKPIVQSLLKEPRLKDLVLLHVDFDTQKAALREYSVRMQSTFVAFKGKQEVGRSTGDTNRASIEKLFDKTS